MGSESFIIALAVGVLMCTFNVQAQDDISRFVVRKMNNFSAWAETNNLDPAPLVSGPSSFVAANNITSLDCTLSNHTVKGHSGKLGTDAWGFLELAYFIAATEHEGNVTFYGDYQCNGTIVDGGSISGEGKWSITVENLLLTGILVAFEELPTGNLNVSMYNPPVALLGQCDNREVIFENLLEDESAVGHEEDILSAVFLGFEKYLFDAGEEHPIRMLYIDYWKEVLAESTVKDLVRGR